MSGVERGSRQETRQPGDSEDERFSARAWCCCGSNRVGRHHDGTDGSSGALCLGLFCFEDSWGCCFVVRNPAAIGSGNPEFLAMDQVQDTRGTDSFALRTRVALFCAGAALSSNLQFIRQPGRHPKSGPEDDKECRCFCCSATTSNDTNGGAGYPFPRF